MKFNATSPGAVVVVDDFTLTFCDLEVDGATIGIRRTSASRLADGVGGVFVIVIKQSGELWVDGGRIVARFNVKLCLSWSATSSWCS